MSRQRQKHGWATWVLALAVAGCAGAPTLLPQMPALTIDRQAFYAQLAHPETSDWSDTRLTSPAVDRLRAEAPKELKAAQRRVQTLGNIANAGFGSRISSAPAFSFWANKAFWITENGTLIRRDAGATDLLSLGDTFVNSAVTLSNDGLRAYLFSNTGKFYVVNVGTSPMAVIGSAHTIGGANNTYVPNAPPPFIDPLASRPDGQIETVYVLSNAGALVRFYVEGRHTTPATPPTVLRKETFNLPITAPATHTEFFRSAPVIIGGKAVVGTWHRANSGDSRLDMGAILYYNTGVTGIPTASTVGAGSLITSIASASPIWAPPAVEFDDNLNPVYAFMPTGYVVTIADLATGDQIQSQPLLAHATTPQSGPLTTASDAGVVYQDVPVALNACLTIGNTTAVPLKNTATPWKDTTEVVASEVYDNTVTEPVFGYMKFGVAAAHLSPPNGTGPTRAILNAVLHMDCNSASNSAANGKKLRTFRVSNNDSTGVPWDNTINTPAKRPAFENGQAFTLGNLNGNKSYELLPLGDNGPAFSNTSKPRWSAKGLVTATGTYSIGMALEDRGYVNTAGNNGMPNRDSAPQFDGAAAGPKAPRLTLELSANGLTTPTMAIPVTIDSANRRIYAVNTNALYVMNYGSPTYDVTPNPYDPLSFPERKASFGDLTKTFFALTQLGRVSGPTSASQYIANLTAPLFTGSWIYVQDHHPGTNQTAITAFTPPAAGTHAPPAFHHAYNLTTTATPNGNPDAQRGGAYMAYDFAGRLYASTYSATAAAGRLWVISQ